MVDNHNNESNDDTASNKTLPKLSPAQERSEYFQKLEKWLQQAYAWQTVAAIFPYYVMSGQALNPIPGAVPSGSQIPTTQNLQQPVGTNVDQQNDLLQQRGATEPDNRFQAPAAEGIEYHIPPIWKRFVAEFIDSTMLFLLKLCITYIAIDVFDIIDMDGFDLLHTNLRIDYKMALEMTYGILVLEIIHRVIVCIFEAFWLQCGMNGRIGGATPGKSMMGLRVVQCQSVTPIERPNETDVVLVYPGTDLGLPLAFARSIVKNLILAFLFPICFALFFFKFNRTGYDLICHSIVVEDSYRNTNNNRVHQD